MMSRIEAELKKLEEEAAAIKQAFQRSAYTLSMFESEKRVSLSKNTVSVSGSGSVIPHLSDFTVRSSARITYQTYSGINTMAQVYCMDDDDNILVANGRRLPYSGGAQWIVRELWTNEPFTIIIYATEPGEIIVEEL